MKASLILKVSLFALASVAALAPVASAADDEITAELDAAKTAYNDGNISGAIQALDMARQLLMQKTAANLANLFPEFKGFRRGEPESSAAGQAMFGGGVTAECEYTAESGDGTFRNKFTAKSPALQGVMMMLNMPGMTGSNDMKVERIAGKRCLVQVKGKSGKIQIVYESELLVEIEFDDVEYEKIKAYIAVIPWDQLGQLLIGG
jgi:hypothetical protein